MTTRPILIGPLDTRCRQRSGKVAAPAHPGPSIDRSHIMDVHSTSSDDEGAELSISETAGEPTRSWRSPGPVQAPHASL